MSVVSAIKAAEDSVACKAVYERCKIPVRDPVSMVRRINLEIKACVRRNPVSFFISWSPPVKTGLIKSKRMKTRVISHRNGNNDIDQSRATERYLKGIRRMCHFRDPGTYRKGRFNAPSMRSCQIPGWGAINSANIMH
jgi:hypothetical protein